MSLKSYARVARALCRSPPAKDVDIALEVLTARIAHISVGLRGVDLLRGRLGTGSDGHGDSRAAAVLRSEETATAGKEALEEGFVAGERDASDANGQLGGRHDCDATGSNWRRVRDGIKNDRI